MYVCRHILGHNHGIKHPNTASQLGRNTLRSLMFCQIRSAQNVAWAVRDYQQRPFGFFFILSHESALLCACIAQNIQPLNRVRMRTSRSEVVPADVLAQQLRTISKRRCLVVPHGLEKFNKKAVISASCGKLSNFFKSTTRR